MTRKRKSDVDIAENCYEGRAGGRDSNALIGAVGNVWSSEFMKNFEKRYGHRECDEKWRKRNLKQRFSSSRSDFREEDKLAADTKNFEHSVEYPSELVEYMKRVACIIRDGSSASDDIRKKCLEECQDFEISLCKYSTSCFLIDEIFNGFRDAARQWFRIIQSRKGTLLELLCIPWACRTLETLLSSLCNALDTEIVDHLVDLVLENWIQLISDRNASHFIRTLIYHLIGLKKARSKGTEKSLMKNVVSEKVQINPATKASFRKIANMALDYASMNAILDNESVSLVLQDVVECDFVFQAGCLRKFVETACRDPDSVLKQWKGKQTSHLWDIIVQKADEDLRQSLYHSVLEGRLFDLSLHMFANFPLQKYILSVKSNELITNVFDELMAHFIDICAECKWRIITALVQMARNRDEVSCTAVGVTGTFDVMKGQLCGSLILQELVNYEHNKTVIMSMKSLANTTVLEMAQDKKGSFLLQAVFKSSTVSRNDKELIAQSLKLKWYELINNNVSSHVFDVLWANDLYNIMEKEELMDALSKKVIENHCKTLRLMCMKLDLRKFREQRKKWLKEQE